MRFYGTIEGGKLSFRPPVALAFATWREKHEGAHIVIEEAVDDRSSGQLRMYRAWLNNMCTHSGNDPDEIHEWLILKLAPVKVSTIKGPKGIVKIEPKKRTSGGHTLSMDKLEMSEFMEKAALLTGYPLPTPEELENMGYIHN